MSIVRAPVTTSTMASVQQAICVRRLAASSGTVPVEQRQASYKGKPQGTGQDG
jgi:hypothetical protein